MRFAVLALLASCTSYSSAQIDLTDVRRTAALAGIAIDSLRVEVRAPDVPPIATTLGVDDATFTMRVPFGSARTFVVTGLRGDLPALSGEVTVDVTDAVTELVVPVRVVGTLRVELIVVGDEQVPFKIDLVRNGVDAGELLLQAGVGETVVQVGDFTVKPPIAGYLGTPPTVTVAAGERATLQYTLTAPELRCSAAAPEDTTCVDLSVDVQGLRAPGLQLMLGDHVKNVDTNGVVTFAHSLIPGAAFELTAKHSSLACSVWRGKGTAAAALPIVEVGCRSTNAFLVGAAYNESVALSFAVDTTTGAITPADTTGVVATSGSRMMAADPTGRFVFAPGEASGDLVSLAVAPDGKVTRVGGPVAIGPSAFWVAVHPSGKFVYANTLMSPQSIESYSVDVNGALTPLASTPVSAPTMQQMVINAQGTFLYVGDYAGGVNVYAIAADGALSLVAGSPFAAPINVVGVLAHPSGRFVYAIASQAMTSVLRAFSVDATTGALTQVGMDVDAGWGDELAIDRFGRFMVTQSLDGGYVLFEIDPLTGVPTQRSSVAAIERYFVHGTFAASGDLLYGLDYSTGTFGVATIDREAATISLVTTQVTFNAEAQGMVYIER